MTRRHNPTSLTLPDDLHKRLKHLCVDRNIRQTQAITQALEDYLKREAESPNELSATRLEIPIDKTLLMRLEKAMTSLDVLREIVIELRDAASRVSEGAVNGGPIQAAGDDRGSVEAD